MYRLVKHFFISFSACFFQLFPGVEDLEKTSETDFIFLNYY